MSKFIICSGYRIKGSLELDKTLDRIVKGKLKEFNEVVLVMGNDRIDVSRCVPINEAIRVIQIPYKKTLYGRFKLLLGKNIISAVKEFIGNSDNDDIIQYRFPNFFSLVCALYCKRLQIEHTFYIAGDELKMARFNYPHLLPLALFKRVIENNLLRNKKVICAGPELASVYSPRSKTHAYFSTTHNSVIRRNYRQTRKKIVYLGSLYKSKRVVDLLDACVLLNDKSYSLVIIGDGPCRNKLEMHSKRNSLNDVVSFVGNIKDERLLASYMLDADILVLPSLTEGTPRVIPEAMSNGVIPVAVASAGSVSHIIQNDVNGILVRPKCPKDIALAIQTISDNDNYYNQLLKGIYLYASQRTFDSEMSRCLNFLRL